MELAKSELFFLLDSIDAESENGSYKAERLAEKVYNALYDDKLDIEGYERVEWIKFDPNDPKTFPPDNGEFQPEYLVYCESYSTPFTAVWFNDLHKFNVSWTISHWRKIPKPPVER